MQAQKELDTRGMNCPLPILKAKKALAEMASGDVLKVVATDPGSVRDFQAFARQTGNELLEQTAQTTSSCTSCAGASGVFLGGPAPGDRGAWGPGGASPASISRERGAIPAYATSVVAWHVGRAPGEVHCFRVQARGLECPSSQFHASGRAPISRSASHSKACSRRPAQVLTSSGRTGAQGAGSSTTSGSTSSCAGTRAGPGRPS